jgi:hypothetical protein
MTSGIKDGNKADDGGQEKEEEPFEAHQKGYEVFHCELFQITLLCATIGVGSRME